MRVAKTKVTNRLGFHLRTVTTIVKSISTFKSKITLSKGLDKHDARSVLDLMLLEAATGTEVTIEIDGPDEDRAMASVLHLFETKFGED